MIGIPAPIMLVAASSGDPDDQATRRRWQAGEKTDDMVYALCGRRGGPKAEAARDRIYAVVVPRIVAELDADALVARIRRRRRCERRPALRGADAAPGPQRDAAGRLAGAVAAPAPDRRAAGDLTVAATARKATPRPESQAASYARQKSQQSAMRLGAFLLVVAAFTVPRILIADRWAWTGGGLSAPRWSSCGSPCRPTRSRCRCSAAVPQHPVLQWLAWGLAAFLAFVALALMLHVSAIYAQRTRPLGAAAHLPAGDRPGQRAGQAHRRPHTAEVAPRHGAAGQPDAAGRAAADALLDRPPGAQDPAGRERGRAGAADHQRAEAAAGYPQRHQSRRNRRSAPGRAAAGPAPLRGRGPHRRRRRPADRRDRQEHTLLAALLPALAPQAGVLAAGVRIVQEPIPDRRWRLDVLTLLERLKLDSGADEQQALKAKAAGPAYRTRIVLLAVAEDLQAGAAQVQTIGAALASSAQAVATSTQRLQAGPVRILPAVVQPPPPFPARGGAPAWRSACSSPSRSGCCSGASGRRARCCGRCRRSRFRCRCSCWPPAGGGAQVLAWCSSMRRLLAGCCRRATPASCRSGGPGWAAQRRHVQRHLYDLLDSL